MNRIDARTDHKQSAYEVFRIPLLLGLVTALGLVFALLGDGAWDALSWLALAVPVWAVLRAWRRRH